MRKPSTVLTSTYVEELKCGIDNIEETGNDLNEGINSEDISEKDISPSSESLPEGSCREQGCPELYERNNQGDFSILQMMN